MKKLEDRNWWPELVELKDVLSLRELSTRFGAAPAAISNALKRSGLDRNAAPPGPRNKRDPELQKAALEALEAVDSRTDGDAAPAKGGKKAAKVAAKAAAEVKAPAKAAKPAKAEKPAKPAKAAKAEPVKAAKAEPVKAEPVKAAKAEPVKAEPVKAEPVKAAKVKAKAAGKPVGRGGSSRIEPFLSLLGKEIDRVIASKAGVTVSAVTNFRKRHGIESASATGPKPGRKAAAKAPAPKVTVEVKPAAAPVAPAPAPAAPAPAPKAAPAPVQAAAPAPAPKAAPAPVAATKAASSGFGYRVTIGGQGFVVVAADISEAARRAMESGRGQVTGIELLGSAISG